VDYFFVPFFATFISSLLYPISTKRNGEKVGGGDGETCNRT